MFCLRWFQRHDWGLWMTTRHVKVMTQITMRGVAIGEPYASGEAKYQERECRRCGKTQMRCAMAEL